MPNKKIIINPPNRELSDDEIKSLTGYFDVLIQMDLQQKHKAKLSETVKENKPKSS